ncbi:hypothetical protein RvY_03105 [Ramazzottius varieornatus]|uniref:Integrase catalytic domain-containing protein n=1 Tax=Ramazzottius varieornatus TaxID=947166 RepID=A0A1D1UTZ9_RAMVA|nr:hypothetical protein RvY_03105 [Ramazzottius varieornatus]
MVTAHWITSDFEIRGVLRDIRELPAEHLADNIQETLLDILRPYSGSLGGVERYRSAELETLTDAKKELVSRRINFPRNAAVLVPDHHWQFQADLMDLQKISKEDKHYRYELVVIDCFSKKLSRVLVKTKHEFNIKKGLEMAFEELGIPDRLQTDKAM